MQWFNNDLIADRNKYFVSLYVPKNSRRGTNQLKHLYYIPKKTELNFIIKD